jgi:Calx-beta domain/Right handed beta helix region
MNSRRRLWIIIIVILIVGIALGLRFCVRQPRAIATRYVSPTGMDSRTCDQSKDPMFPKQHLKGGAGALQCMVGGDTLILLPGMYSENIDTTIDNIPSGTAGANTQLIGSGTAILLWPGGSTIMFALYQSANNAIGNYITIQNIIFDGGTTAGKTANVTGIVLNDLNNRSPMNFGPPPNNDPIPDHTDQFVTLDNIEVRNFGSNGILIGSGRDRIINSRLHDNGWYNCVPDNTQCSNTPGMLNYGYNIYYAAGYYGVIDNNEIYNAGRYGLQLYGQLGDNTPGAFVTISKNRVHDNGVLNYGSGIFAGAQNQKIFNNIVYNNKGLNNQSNGIELGDSGTSNILVYNNIVYGNGQDGIRDNNCAIGGYSACTIQNNTVWGNGRYGIETGGSIGDIIQNNAVDSNTVGNIHNSSASGVMYATNFCTTMTGPTGACQFFGNPNFKDITSVPPDLHLTAASTQLIDKGTVNIAVADDDGMTRDIDGEVRVGAFDIGADEFSTGQVSGPGTLEFSMAAYSVNENVSSGNAAITITRTNGSTGVVGVTLTLGGGTSNATAGSDYTDVTGTYMLGDTVTSLPVNIPILDDQTFEGNETLHLMLSAPTGGATLGTLTMADLTIVDNDVANYVTVDSYPNVDTVCDGTMGRNCDGSRTLTPTRTQIGQVFTVPGGAGPTYTAATCNQTDVNAWINGPMHTAVNGDTIQIPAGSCSWNSAGIVVPGGIGITIRGVGTPTSAAAAVAPSSTCASGTTITVSGGITAFRERPSYGNATSRISCMTLVGDTSAIFANILGTCTASGCPDIRWDNLTFNGWAGIDHPGISYGMSAIGDVFGVIDHNAINGSMGTYLVLTEQSNASYLGVGFYGDNAWAQPEDYGTSKFLFYENNTFSASGCCENEGGANAGAQSRGGGRVVVRFNQFTNMDGLNTAMAWHGTETNGRSRGSRAYEFYANTYTCSTSCNQVAGVRSGTGILWGNTINITSGGGLNVFFSMNTYRTKAKSGGWGACDGASPYDANDGVTYYSGTVLSGGGTSTITVSGNPGWTDAQWFQTGAPYSVHDVPKDNGIEIANNGSNTIDLYYEAAAPAAWLPANGDMIEIRRATKCIDQAGGVGAGVLYSGDPAPSTPAAQSLSPTYIWMSDFTMKTPIFATSTAGVGFNTNRILRSRDFYVENLNQTAQTSASAPFDGTATVGIGHGTFVRRPMMCATGVVYWATDQGSWNTSGSGPQGLLYRCSATNMWTPSAFYTPYTYPHPLTIASPTSYGLRQSEFLVSKENAPTGNAVSKLYAIMGTPGVDAKPMGQALATSTPVDVSTFQVYGNYAFQRFTFPGTPPTLTAGTPYAIVVEYTLANGANDVPLGRDILGVSTPPMHPGNEVEFDTLTGWAALSDRDIIFAVYGDTAGSLQLGQQMYTVNENGGSVAVTVTRTGGTAGVVSATLATANGSAMAGSDYTALTTTVTFANNDAMTRTYAIAITDDMAVEQTESFTVSLTNFIGATPGTTTSATITINDNDAVGPTLAVSPNSIAPGGTVTATWSGIASPTATDWIGLYQPGAAGAAYIDWIYVSCSQTAMTPRASGSCPFVLPSNLAPGPYELRLYAADNATVLLATTNFTVVATTPASGFFFGRRR